MLSIETYNSCSKKGNHPTHALHIHYENTITTTAAATRERERVGGREGGRLLGGMSVFARCWAGCQCFKSVFEECLMTVTKLFFFTELGYRILQSWVSRHLSAMQSDKLEHLLLP